VAPLNQPRLLADMDLLTLSDEADEYTPSRNSIREVDEVLRLGLARLEPRRARVLLLHHLGIECPLGFVEHDDVFRRDQARP
jgi:hypothetical protein